MRSMCTFMLVAAVAPAFAQSRPRATDVAFLAGCWSFERNGRTVEEHWLAPSGGSLLGVSRTVAGGQTTEYEFVQIRETAEGLVYIARPSNQAEASFTAVSSAPGAITFENPAHDFPQRISYRREGEMLLARIEGTTNGKARAVEFPYKRSACAP